MPGPRHRVLLLAIGLLLACQRPAPAHPTTTIPAHVPAPASVVQPAPPPQPAIRRPFASHAQVYTAGHHLPHGDRAALDAATAAFYDQWSARYLLAACAPDQLVVAANAGRSVPINPSGQAPGSLTTSEAHGYGMLIVALMAGHDPLAQTRFDALYRYYRAHPAEGAPRLMAWNQVTTCRDAHGDSGSATDGDLDIGFALLVADAQWGSAGTVDYRGAALALLAQAVELDLLEGSDLPSLGSDAHDMEVRYRHGTRTSDFMPDHFRVFARATGQKRWQRAADASLTIAQNVQTAFSKVGLLPDFIVGIDTSTPHPAPAHYLESAHDGMYSWNACRVPWRMATDWLVTGDARSLAITQKLTAFFVAHSQGLPAAVGEGVALTGKPLPDADGESLAFLAPLTVAALLPEAPQPWLNALWDTLVARPLTSDDYYGNTLKMLTMIVVSGNWFAP